MSIFAKAVELLQSGESFALATIISQDGSSPRGTGAKMIITHEAIYETIGGGGMEAEVIRIAREQVLPGKKSYIKYFDLTGKNAEHSALICGGEVEILIDYMDAGNRENILILQAAGEAAKNGERAWLITVIDSNPGAEHPRQFCFSGEKTGIIGSFSEYEDLALDMLKSPFRTSLHGDAVENLRVIVDPIYTGGTLYIFGAGHVSTEVAKVAGLVGFHTVVIDDREEFANPHRFPQSETVVVSSFADIPEFPVDEHSYILIITRGHAHDKTVLRWAIKTKAYYIGMIGSKPKRDKVYADLEAEGVAREKLKQVCCPVGLSISATTPAEIAVSIVAELICKRAEKAKDLKF